MYRLLKNKNEGLRAETLALARELVRTPSPSYNEAGVAEIVELVMRDIGFDRIERDDAGNVVGVLFGRGDGKTVVLNAHMDTIRPGHGPDWQDQPDAGAIIGDRLHGVGASDCKAGLAAQLQTVALLKRSLLPLKGNIVVAATVAEELGGSPGVRALLENTLPELGLKPDYAILGEPTGLDLYYGHDGWADLDVTVRGGNPFQVQDAADAIYRDFDMERRRDSACMGLGKPEVFESGGVRSASIRVLRRFRPSEGVGAVIGTLRHQAGLIAGGSGSVAVDVAVSEETQQLYNGNAVQVRRVVNAWATAPFDPLIDRARQALAAAECAATPGTWALGRIGMGTAGSVFLNEFDMPTVGYGPGEEDACHTAGESVSVAKLHEAVYGTAAIVHSLVGVPVYGWTSDEI